MNRQIRSFALPVAALAAAMAVASIAAQPAGQSGAARSGEAATRPYYPPRRSWEHRKPSEVGMDEAKLNAAIEYAKTRDSNWGKTDYMADQVRTFGRPLGPVPQSHSPTNGIVVRHGYIVAEFGDLTPIEPTYSVAKSYLSTILGIAIDRGLIKSITDPVANYVHDGGYDSAHNAKITWEHHARQSSEWEGTLFGKPSTFIGHEEFGNGEMKPRDIREPGTFYEYNDVRVNRFSLSLARVWKRAIPDVAKTELMDPIGASDTWKWLGYDNADVEIDGKTVKSVPGGTRWGGGIWMNTWDHARYGLLMLRQGKWNDRQIVSAGWVKEATTQGGPPNSGDYGFLWWLNTKGGAPAAGRGRGRGGASPFPPLPASSYQARGNGSHTIYIDPVNDLVVVWRWNGGGDFFNRVVGAVVQ
jgi:CubicO group peptidase (beta-lactamase class C family)